MRKLILAGTVAILALGASTMNADQYYWSGSGQQVEWESIYPWHSWHGTLLNGTFQGVWWEGSDGEAPPWTYPFFGSIIYYYTPDDGGDTFAHCEGDWCIDPHNGTLRMCGSFTMEFNISNGTCEGVWVVNGDESITGNMWGNGY